MNLVRLAREISRCPLRWVRGPVEPGPFALLMTATITPQVGLTGLKRTDPAVRRQDYIKALRFYLEVETELVDRIVFVENSNSDISDLRAIAQEYPNKQVEIVSYYGLDYPASYGRGYGEYLLMETAFEESRILRDLPPDEVLWKVTGRYILSNYSRLWRTIPSGAKFYIDVKPGRKYADTRTFAASRSSLEKFVFTARESMRTSASERELFRVLQSHFDDLDFVGKLRVVPSFDAVAGGSNQKFYVGAEGYSDFARRALSYVAPRLWF